MSSMKNWVMSLAESKKPLPILSFPSAKLLGVTVYQLTHDAKTQASGIIRVASETDSAAAVTMMDLSVEAEAFGCEIKADENEVPTVLGALITDEDEARALAVPEMGTARTGMFVEAAKLAKEAINDRPVLAGMIGPFSLAGRLMDVSEALVNCIAEPDFVHIALDKALEFLVSYAKAYKEAGLDGIVLAEPLSGLLSPDLEEEFSAPYVKKLIELVQDDDFIVIYHNCGPNVPLMTESLVSNGAAAYHFGDAVDLKEMLEKMPENIPVCGNISPSEQFLNGTPDSMKSSVTQLLEKCSVHKNFVLSSGCDIPPASSWENINAFFEVSKDFYA